MTGIDTAMLAAMRDAIGELLPDTCFILSKTSTPDGYGGMTDTWGTASSSACRVDIVRNRSQQTGDAMQPYSETILSVPYDTTIDENYRVLHGSNTYAVISPTNADGSWLAVKRVRLELV